MFTAFQPTGNLHIGNYLGAIKNFVTLQNSGAYRNYLAIADLHSLTGDMEAVDRHGQIIRTVVELVSVGVDPEKTVLYVQSHVSAHAELAWILNCVTPVAELERMTQFKDKSIRQEKNINAGLFTYPILMAADILLYKTVYVPVGEDQIQHIELTRDIAKKFNNRFGEFFVEPKELLADTPRIMSLLDPTAKMSKSKGKGHVIELSDEPAVIEAKLKKAVTATEVGRRSPGVENLFLLLQNFSNEKTYRAFVLAEKNGSIRYGDLKNAVACGISEYFALFRERRKKLLINHNEIADILIIGAQKANLIAQKTIDDTRKLVGIR